MNIEAQPANRTGVQTTEFWLTLLINLMTPFMVYVDKIDGTLGIIVSGVVTAIYAVLRAAVKNNLLNKTAPTPTGNEGA